jgi:hypothetical protein
MGFEPGSYVPLSVAMTTAPPPTKALTFYIVHSPKMLATSVLKNTCENSFNLVTVVQ